MRMLAAKSVDGSVVISAWCAPGSRQVNYRYGRMCPGSGEIEWWPVEFRDHAEPVTDVVAAMRRDWRYVAPTITVAP